MINGIVYLAFDTSNGKCYVGQTTTTLEERRRQHAYSSSCCRKFKNALLVRPDAFVWKVLTECDNQTTLDAAEVYWIEFFECVGSGGYNLRSGGSHGKLSEETRHRMSIARTGRKLSPEHREATRRGSIGKKMTEEAKQKIAEAARWKNLSEETRAKKRAEYDSRVGKTLPESTRLKMAEAQRRRRERERML